MKTSKTLGKARSSFSGQFQKADVINDHQLRSEVLKRVEAFDSVCETLDFMLVGCVRDKQREPVAMLSQTLLLLGAMRAAVASQLDLSGVSVPAAPDLVLSGSALSGALAKALPKGRRK